MAQQSFVTNEGISDNDLRGVDAVNSNGDKTVMDVLHSFGEELKNDVLDAIDQANALDIGTLRQSLNYKVILDAKGILFAMGFFEDGAMTKELEYAKYMDKGVRGTGVPFKNGRRLTQKAPNSPFAFQAKGNKIPIKAIRGWAERHNINPYALREAIKKQGIKPRGFWSKVVTEDRLIKLQQDIAKASRNEVLITTRKGYSSLQGFQVGKR